MKRNLRKKLLNNKGSGLGVILYGITLLLILIFTAINIVNAKVIENGYNSLRDAVQSASSGSVIHLLTTNRTTEQGATSAQANRIEEVGYDIYLQLALGYLINRNTGDVGNDKVVQTGDINNFIKLDHQKVVNSTLALLENGVARNKQIPISDFKNYKIMMFFIEPYRDDDTGEKYFDIIAYGNGDYNGSTITKQLAKYPVNSTGKRNMEDVYDEIQESISRIVNCEDGSMSSEDKSRYKSDTEFFINLNSSGDTYDKLIRDMETYPHYLIVVKDFALPTIFDGDTNDSGTGIKGLFTELSGDGSLSAPMCALNTGKVQRQTEDEGWTHR